MSKSDWWMSKVCAAPGHADPEPDHGAGHLVHIEREVLATHADLGVDDPVRTQRGRRRAGHDGGGDPVVDDRRHAAGVLDLRLGPRCRRTTSVHELRDQLGQLAPGLAAEHPDGAAQVALDRDRVGRLAGVDRPEHHGDGGPRVDPAVQQGRHVDDDPAERVHQVAGQVRAGRVPAAARSA